MSDITLSSSVRSNLLALQNTADLLGATQERLATGLKVNSALDDPTAFFTASSLNARASDLNRLQDFVGNAVQTLRAADEGIEALTNLVESAEATARQALQTAGSTSEFIGNNTTALNLTDTFNGLDSDFAADFDIVITTASNVATTINFKATGTVQDLVTAINDNSGSGSAVDNISTRGTVTVGSTSGANVRASLTTDGKLQLQATAAEAITIEVNNDANGADTGFTDAVALLGLNSSNATITAGTAGAEAKVVATIAAGSLSTDRSSFATQFDDLRTQIDQLAADASFNGVNLLNGDSLTVTFNEDSTSSLGISGVTFDAAGLGVTTSDNTFQTDFDVNAAITELTTATNTLRSQASKFGNNLSVVETRQDFTKNLINVLETGAANLTLADTNEEGANLLALQTRQQLSSTALSLASQADQNVLRLF
ncbi:MAG: flagellin [Pseudomonadota bacterium]